MSQRPSAHPVSRLEQSLTPCCISPGGLLPCCSTVVSSLLRYMLLSSLFTTALLITLQFMIATTGSCSSSGYLFCQPSTICTAEPFFFMSHTITVKFHSMIKPFTNQSTKCQRRNWFLIQSYGTIMTSHITAGSFAISFFIIFQLHRTRIMLIAH